MGEAFDGFVAVGHLVEQDRASEAMAREARDRTPRWQGQRSAPGPLAEDERLGLDPLDGPGSGRVRGMEEDIPAGEQHPRLPGLAEDDGVADRLGEADLGAGLAQRDGGLLPPRGRLGGWRGGGRVGHRQDAQDECAPVEPACA